MNALMNFLSFLFFLIMRWGFYLFFFFSPSLKSSPTKKAILIIRLDAIGDYILFRNFIQEIHQAKKYKGYDLYVLGNAAWQDLALFLDSKYVKKFIWVDMKKITRSFPYAHKKIAEIKRINFSEVINPVYSRTLLMDLLVKNTTSKVKIGFFGDSTNILKVIKKLSDRFYTSLLFSKKEIYFDFFKNRFFFEQILQKKLTMRSPKITSSHCPANITLPKKYVAFFIGASKKFRKWNLRNFQEIANWLQKTPIPIVVLGGKNELAEVATLRGGFFINLVGKLSLKEITGVLKNAQFLLSNDTFAPHLAIALGLKKVMVVSNGNSFGRFFPYPKKVSSRSQVVFPLKIRANDFTANYQKYRRRSFYNINSVTPAMVKKAIEEMLSGDTK